MIDYLLVWILISSLITCSVLWITASNFINNLTDWKDKLTVDTLTLIFSMILMVLVCVNVIERL